MYIPKLGPGLVDTQLARGDGAAVHVDVDNLITIAAIFPYLIYCPNASTVDG